MTPTQRKSAPEMKPWETSCTSAPSSPMIALVRPAPSGASRRVNTMNTPRVAKPMCEIDE